eukprot:m.250780 g.250780  ORF g.250780 m.250780 type:complete len:76 (+) comp17180_c0_seq2:164-391(+)
MRARLSWVVASEPNKGTFIIPFSPKGNRNPMIQGTYTKAHTYSDSPFSRLSLQGNEAPRRASNHKNCCVLAWILT